MKIFELHLFWITLAPSYYGLMYILWFLYGILYLKKFSSYTQKQRDALFFYIFMGVVLWGRIWYIVFYNFQSFFSDPLVLFRIWEGGMSFHGWLIWVCLSIIIFSQKYKLSLWKLADFISLIIPVWLFFGRIGNYLNKELLWFPYTGFLAVETQSGSFFPSPLVEAFLEGIVLFLILHFFARKKCFPGYLTSLFFIFYGIFRTWVELFIRTPDAHIGYYLWFLTQGSFLSIPMIIIGFCMYFFLKKNDSSK